jgi:hypothetical protein
MKVRNFWAGENQLEFLLTIWSCADVWAQGHWYTSIFIRPKTDDIKLKLFMRNHFHFNVRVLTVVSK